MKSFVKNLLPETLNKLFYILPSGDPGKLVILFFFMLIAAGLEVAGIGIIPAFVAIVADPEQVLRVDWLQALFTFLDINSSRDLLIWGSIALVSVFLIKSSYFITYNFYVAKFIYRRRYLISKRLISSYMQAPYTFHLQRNSAELLRNITGEVNVLINIILTNILNLSKEGLISTAILLFLFFTEPFITLLVMTLSSLGAGTFIYLVRDRMKRYGAEEQERRANMIKAVNQGLGGIKDARVLNRENEFIDKFSKEALASTRLMAYLRFIQQVPKPVVETTAVIGMLMISVILVWQGRDMNAIIPILTLFAMATVRLMPSIQSLTSQYTNLRYNLVSIDSIYDDLKELEKYSLRLREDRNKELKVELEKQIEVNNVFYHYPQSEEQALDGVSCTIPKGSAIAFVGESGAGKTTIVDMLLGLLEPVKGSIKVDGRDIQQNLSAWQRNIGYIPQSIYLCDESLRNNIAFGLPEKDIDDEKVMQALSLAQLKTMVESMPKGLDTIIGENGTSLSGGQRQRVGIARALYHNPQVLVMDEATSALDNITEKQITNAIDALKGDRTIIMIAHRLTTVKNCDVLYFMKKGRIIQKGTYKELVHSNKQFREMAMET